MAQPRPPDNAEIAVVLDTIADLLELEAGTNPWRVRAYRNAVKTLERLGTPLHQMVAHGDDLTQLSGIGGEMAKHVTEIVTTGRSALLDRLAEDTPPTLVELAKVRGIGLKKARVLHQDLGIKTLDELERAIEIGWLQRAKGFGEKTAQKLLAAAAAHRARAESMKLTEAVKVADWICAFMKEEPSVAEIQAVGAFRRQHEVLDRLDLLACSRDPARVLDRFVAHAGLEDIERDDGGDRVRARLRKSIPIELRVVPPAMFGSALFLATGSDAHIAAIVGDSPPRAHEDEADVYRDAGLPLIPPELRENAGEIEAAKKNALPRLVARGEIKGDLQMHTHWSDGRYTVAQMAEACRERGYDYLAITDHSGSLTIANGLTPERLEEQWKEIDAARAAAPGIAILKSSEVDILPDGSLDLPGDHLHALDCVLASVHVQQRMPRKEMTARILRAIEHPAVDILGHPTGKRGRRPPYEVELDVVLRACAELGVAVELDCSPDRTDLPAEQIRRAIELGCTIAVDTDAHSIRELDYMVYGVGQARRAWAEPDRILNCLRWPAFRTWLQRRGRRANLDAVG